MLVIYRRSRLIYTMEEKRCPFGFGNCRGIVSSKLSLLLSEEVDFWCHEPWVGEEYIDGWRRVNTTAGDR